MLGNVHALDEASRAQDRPAKRLASGDDSSTAAPVGTRVGSLRRATSVSEYDVFVLEEPECAS